MAVEEGAVFLTQVSSADLCIFICIVLLWRLGLVSWLLIFISINWLAVSEVDAVSYINGNRKLIPFKEIQRASLA